MFGNISLVELNVSCEAPVEQETLTSLHSTGWFQE